ncbi:MAG: trigger factor [Herpetosiphon sp.]
MKVTSERLPKSLIALNIELDQQQVNTGLDRAARKLSQQYRIPGFRPGKAPRFIVENYLSRERVLEEASDDLMNAALKDAIKAENLSPVGQAQLENFEPEPFHFRVLVPVEPTIELASYSGIHVPLEQEPVTEESVQKLLNAQREQHVVLKPIETPRPAQEGDQLTVRLTSDLDEETAEAVIEAEEAAIVDELDDVEAVELLADAEAAADMDIIDADVVAEADEDEDVVDEADEDAHPIILEQGRTRPEFLAALLGTEPGDSRTVTITYGEDETNEALRGKTVTYTLQVEEMQERLLPEWEELPTLTDFDGDIEGMRTKARDRLEHAASEKARREVTNKFIERLVADSTVDMPDAMVNERAAQLFHQSIAQFQRYGLSEDQILQSLGKSHDEAVAEYHEEAERDMRSQLVVAELLKREGITVTEDEIAAEVVRFLDEYEPSRREEFRPMLESPEMRRMVASTALDRKLRDHVVTLATSASADATTSEHSETPAEAHSAATGGAGEGESGEGHASSV